MDTTMEKRAAARTEMRLREYQSELADLVRAGELTDMQANEWLVAVQDRLARDGAWG